MQNYEYFLRARKKWEMGKSGVYFKLLNKEFGQCNSLEQIEEVVDANIEQKGSIIKIKNILSDIFKENFVDISCNVPSKFHLIDKIGGEKRAIRKTLNPWITCMEAGLIPVLMTKSLLSKDYYPQYLAYIIEDIFNTQI